MSIEWTIIFSAVSVMFGVWGTASTLRRALRAEARSDQKQLTTVIVKLENIGIGISQIREEINAIKTDISQTRERLIKVEESTKQAHKRIDAGLYS